MRFVSEESSENRSIWMSPEEINDPWELVRHFCKIHSLTSCRFFLWQMLSNSVSAEGQHIDASAGEQVYFFENLMPFIEAIFLIARKDGNTTETENCEINSKIKSGTASALQEDEILTSKHFTQKHDFTKSRFKKKRRYLRNYSIWFREPVREPFKIIEAFFDAYSLASFKTYLIHVLQAISEEQYYQKGSPSDVLYLMEKWESIINTAYILQGIDWRLAGATSDSIVTNMLTRNENSITEWSQMLPSLLNKDEILNPQQVLTDFFQYKCLKEWKQELVEINSFALSKHPAHEWGSHIDSLSIFVYSVKLAEALYLLAFFKNCK